MNLPESVSVQLGLDEPDDSEHLRARIADQLGIESEAVPAFAVRKRSLDCRRGRVRFVLLCTLGHDDELPGGRDTWGLPHPIEVRRPARVVIVGDGPCGMFCAYQLARHGIASVVLDRGKPVQPRRRDLKGLTRKHTVDPDSNYCFGEGGAGTYSDGKLYTRAHKRGDVRDVLEILAAHGAPESILLEARPHIGSNLLPQVVTAMRRKLEGVGVEFRFGARVTQLLRRQRRVVGVELADGERIDAAAVVLATGHSARDVFNLLHEAGHPLELKSFAVGVRIEHPQQQVNAIQYGRHAGHPKLPSAAYRLVDTVDGRSVFSFCMCPGGFIVPASTEPGEVVVNGMSPSKRNSKYANSGIVVSIDPSHLSVAGYAGPLAGVELQRAIEQAAFVAGGQSLSAPGTRLVDALAGRTSSTLPPSSYVPGLTAVNLAEVLDGAGLPLFERMTAGLKAFGKTLPGFITDQAVLVGVESRTSSPVRIPRDAQVLESPHWPGLYPAGEGAGYAGGIMSAALDGMRVARAIITAS